MYGEVQTASTWSRRGTDARTLEQETVDALNEAGYEAYHVTADNHDMLEDELNTSFVDMGINPYGSYIVVIDEGEAEAPASTYSRISPEIDFEGPGNNGGKPSTYTYNGVTYDVRYVTISPTDEDDLDDPLKESAQSIWIHTDLQIRVGMILLIIA